MPCLLIIILFIIRMQKWFVTLYFTEWSSGDAFIIDKWVRGLLINDIIGGYWLIIARVMVEWHYYSTTLFHLMVWCRQATSCSVGYIVILNGIENPQEIWIIKKSPQEMWIIKKSPQEMWIIKKTLRRCEQLRNPQEMWIDKKIPREMWIIKKSPQEMWIIKKIPQEMWIISKIPQEMWTIKKIPRKMWIYIHCLLMDIEIFP